MTLNRIKLGRAFDFKKYLAGISSLIFLPKTLIWEKFMFWISNSLSLVELVVNELMKSISQKNYRYFFPSDLSLLVVKISRAYN